MYGLLDCLNEEERGKLMSGAGGLVASGTDSDGRLIFGQGTRSMGWNTKTRWGFGSD